MTTSMATTTMRMRSNHKNNSSTPGIEQFPNFATQINEFLGKQILDDDRNGGRNALALVLLIVGIVAISVLLIIIIMICICCRCRKHKQQDGSEELRTDRTQISQISGTSDSKMLEEVDLSEAETQIEADGDKKDNSDYDKIPNL